MVFFLRNTTAFVSSYSENSLLSSEIIAQILHRPVVASLNLGGLPSHHHLLIVKFVTPKS